EEAIGLAIRDVTALWNEDEARQEWRAFLHAGHASGEYQLRRKDGSLADVEFSAVANIEPNVHLTVLRDVTARKVLERHSLRAQRMESLGTLAGGIAHDLNNALAPILMSIELLRDKGDPDRQEVLDTIERSAQRGADMVRQVLSFARGVEGQRVDVSIAALVRDVEKIANDTFLKHLQVRVEVAPDLWTVRGDPTQIHQVLLNLCVNARDAMPNGGTLALDAENKDLDERFAAQCPEAIPGAYVCITVADTGSGIPPAVLDRIFEPFFTTKSFGQGTGLGLSTSLAIVKSHGGFIRVQTSPAEGTRFHIYLPAGRAVAAAAHQSPATALPSGRGQLVLVIDDEAAVREVTRRTLEAHGYRVLLAAGGAEGVAAYARHQLEIAVVITDMMMPLMDGAATMAALRGINPDVRIIAASGLPEDAHVKEAGEAGAAHFLAKPFTAETLLGVLQQALLP
ncbi:MAG: ATP-binding protein, partial [Acidobacteria bacterium]|nr:ATP-binding protein [Acidobacteriota bacterium]